MPATAHGWIRTPQRETAIAICRPREAVSAEVLPSGPSGSLNARTREGVQHS